VDRAISLTGMYRRPYGTASSRRNSSGYVLLKICTVCAHRLNQVDPHDASILVTEPYFNLPNIQDVYDQFIFEEYEFDAYLRSTCASPLPFTLHGALRG
jgi:hypothetical protein